MFATDISSGYSGNALRKKVEKVEKTKWAQFIQPPLRRFLTARVSVMPSYSTQNQELGKELFLNELVNVLSSIHITIELETTQAWETGKRCVKAWFSQITYL